MQPGPPPMASDARVLLVPPASFNARPSVHVRIVSASIASVVLAKADLREAAAASVA